MLTRRSRILCLLFTASLVIAACTPSYATEDSEVSDSLQVLETSFIARVISLEPGKSAAFIAHLQNCYLPVWRQLCDEGIVNTVSVFELSHYDSTATSTSAQDYLVLAELSSKAKPVDLLDAEKVSACPDHRDFLRLPVVRSAHMSCTPNSCYGTPEPAYQDAPSGISFLVELIGVEETPPALAKYREIMIKYGGPANGILVERGMMHCFIALENVNLMYDTPGAVPWNQIHISDDWDEGGDVDWDSVYTELFQTEFSCDQDSVWAQLPNTDKTRADYHGRLISKLCVR